MVRFQNRAGVRPARRCDRAQARRGHAVIELALLLPWLVLTFVAALDFGMYNYALICTQSAARVGAMAASVNATATASCATVLDELQNAPGANCTTTVQVTTLHMPDAASGSPDGQPAVKVTVTYQTPQLIPLPGVLSGSLTVSRTVQMPIRGSS